jgi:hypothetical protein
VNVFRPHNPTRRRPHRGGWLGAGLAVGAFGLAMATVPLPAPRPAHLGAADTQMALQILSDSTTLISVDHSNQVTTVTATPTPTPASTSAATPAPTTSPCPGNVHITNTGPNSTTHYSCRSTVTTRSGSSSNVSIQSSSNQSSTGGNNSSTSNTSITITNQ